MGITDGTKTSSSAKAQPPAPAPVITVDDNGCGSAALPQMVITSVEGVDEQLQLKDVNGMEPSPEPPQTTSEVVQEPVEMASTEPQPPVVPQEPVQSSFERTADDLQLKQEVVVPEDKDELPSSVPSTEAAVPLVTSVSPADQRPLTINGCEEPKIAAPEHVAEESVPSTKPVSQQSAVQRPLRIDGSDTQPAVVEAQPGPEDATKEVPRPSQSAAQRPLVFDADASKKAEKSPVTRPESIYEIIEPRDSELEIEESFTLPKETEIDGKAATKSKDGDGFFAKSKTFFKHDAKHIFTFPKFTFGSKEPKESKSSKKEDISKLENEDVKESTKQEYSLLDAAAQKDTGIETYKKIDADAVVSHTSSSPAKAEPVVIKPEPSAAKPKPSAAKPKPSAAKQKPSAMKSEPSAMKPEPSAMKPEPSAAKPEPQAAKDLKQKDSVIITERSALIHPVSVDQRISDALRMKAEEENFDLDQLKDGPQEPKRAGTPDTLYDTCCLKLASLIRHKAIEIAADVSKSSAPKKPPKPTPAALAKARSAVAVKKLEEMESRHHTFGEDLPAGFNGIQYVDEDTESSNDYKDVENFGVVLNPECYGIIRKMKMENKSGSFRASSICSGMSSYYTADSATLKGENSSDDTLVTVSLGSSDSIVCRPSSLPAESKDATSKTKEGKGGDLASTPHKRSAFVSFFFPSKKKVPPPVPPKPSGQTPTSPETVEEAERLSRSHAKDVARCVNSLSLSPRPVHKTPQNDTAGIRKRPLTIVGIKDAEMLLLNKQIESITEPKSDETASISKHVPLVKSDLSRPTRNLPVQPASLSKPFTYPTRTPEGSSTRKTKPEPPPRPPPPAVTSPQKVPVSSTKPAIIRPTTQSARLASSKSPPISPKPKVPPSTPKASPVRKAPTVPQKPILKQLVSPPRPSPPATKPAVPPNKPQQVPPPRPPPPSKVSSPAVKLGQQIIPAVSEKPSDEKAVESPSEISIPIEQESSKAIDEDTITEDRKLKPESADGQALVISKSVEVEPIQHELIETCKMEAAETLEAEPKFEDVPLDSSGVQKSEELPAATDTLQYQPGTKLPKPPPRGRRIRSRTVEIAPVTEKAPGLRRSQSLSDADIEKRKESSKISPPENPELTHLYTTVHKDPSKAKPDLFSPTDAMYRRSPSAEELSSRPLPPPPLPPRSKSRSSSRRSKSDERPSASNSVEKELSLSKSESMPSELNGHEPLKPPVRKKKGFVQKFSTVGARPKHGDTEKNKPHFYSLKFPKDSGTHPVRPERRIKHPSQPIVFDENANVTAAAPGVVASPTVTPRQNTSPHYATPNSRPRGRSMGSGIPDSSSPEEKGKSSMYQRSVSEMPASKKHSTSWYDEDIGKIMRDGSLDDSWEKVNWQTEVARYSMFKATPPRKKKHRETSKFYVEVPKNDVEQTTPSSETRTSIENLPISTSEMTVAVAHENQLLSPEGATSWHGHDTEGAPSSPPPPPPTPTADKETSPLPLSCSEKSVQTSLETLSVSRASRGEMSDDTDDLLDLAQTLQKELKTIITRHKAAEKSDEDSESTEGTSSKVISSLPVRQAKLPNSSTSSSSELWQISSSEESEEEGGNPQHSNLSEVSLAKKQKKIFYAAQEIMSSEETFVEALKLLNVDFRSHILEANKQKGAPVVPDEILNQILNHLPQLQHLNENLLMELKDRIENWEKVHKIADVIVKMGPFLKLYSWYIQDFEATTALLEESKRRYQLFGQCVKEFEATSKCKRLTLNHYMLKPVQRIPQYRLLLQEYLHHLPDDSEDYEDTVEALRIVSDVANHANESMRQGDNMQKLISIQNSIMGHKEIIKPGRMFLKEGELMKLSRKGMQPRWFVLFNDLLLYLTPVQQGLYRINHELTLAGMKVAIPIQQDYQNEFSIISVTRSFTLAAKSPEERQEWIIALTKAIEENASKRSTFTNVRLHQKSQESADIVDDEGFVLGKKAPVWIPDARVTMCQLCTSEFTVTFRRHHCRACGKVVCSICSSNRISLQYLGNRIARVCDECYGKLGQGSTACTESGETDSDNQQLAVKSHLRTDHWHHKKPKRQLPSVLKEVCANDKGSTISGYIHKRVNKSWKRNWFVVKDKVLYEYRASEDVAALRSIPLLGFQINTFTEPYEGIEACLLFELSHPGRPPILFHADTPGFAERWIKELRDATVLE